MVNQIWKGWKVLAIVFIILFVLETVIFIWAFYLGAKEVNNESICAVNICQNATAYTYVNNLCSCYDNGQVVNSQYLGG